MKIILRVYKNDESLEGQFFSLEEAQGIVEIMAEKYPHLVFEPYMELDDNCVIDISELEKSTVQKSNNWNDFEGPVVRISYV